MRAEERVEDLQSTDFFFQFEIMPFALSPAAQQIAKRYTGKQREFLYALVSCPYPITVNCLRAVVKRFGMTYAVG